MAGFDKIIGQEKLIRHFENAIRLNKISHAYIIDGEIGMGKKMIANAFAQTVECEEGGIRPCMKCHSCKQALSGNNPDIRQVVHEKPNTISVEEIRTQVNQDILIRPYEYRKKIYIIDEAEKMTVQAQNTLLKTIEEPPEYGLILLLTSNKEMLLETILSRCVVMEMMPVKPQLIVDYLMKNNRIVDYRAREAAAFSGGNIGKAIQMSSSDDFFLFKDEMLQIIKHIDGMNTADMNTYIKELLKNHKNDLEEYLNLIEMWYRDVLFMKAANSDKGLLFVKETKTIRNQSEKLSFTGINEIFEAVAEVRRRLHVNVNTELTLEMLFIKIKNAFNGNIKIMEVDRSW